MEAPTTASIVLARILLKLGGVGLVRIMKTLSFVHLNLFIILAFIGIVLSAIGCMFQRDMKGLIAQSSVAHMGFVFIGTNLISVAGKTRAFVVMLGHGYASALMFYYAGVLSHAVGTRMLYYLNRLIKTRVSLSLRFRTVILANRGAPLRLTFFGEFIGFCGLLSQFKLAIIVLGLYFFFSFYRRVFLLTNTLMGKKSVQIEEWPACYSFGLLFMVFNFVVFELLV